MLIETRDMNLLQVPENTLHISNRSDISLANFLMKSSTIWQVGNQIYIHLLTVLNWSFPPFFHFMFSGVGVHYLNGETHQSPFGSWPDKKAFTSSELVKGLFVKEF